MPLRNGPHGYGFVTKALHWTTVLAILGQFAVGLRMEADDTEFDRQDDVLDELEKQAKDRDDEAAEEHFDRLEDELKASEDAFEDDYVGAAFSDVFSGNAFHDGVSLPEAHILLGLSILALGLLRVLWRATTPLPPWANFLGQGERRLESLLEKTMLTMLFAVPLSGLLLIAAGGDWLVLHIAAQLVLIVAVVLHVSLVLTHTVLQRDGHLARMT